jgi:hypothetical protein
MAMRRRANREQNENKWQKILVEAVENRVVDANFGDA